MESKAKSIENGLPFLSLIGPNKRPALKKVGNTGMGGNFFDRCCFISLGFMILYSENLKDEPDAVFVWNDVFRYVIH